MEPLRFNVFGRIVLVQREAGLWQAYALGPDGKRSPAGFVIPDFIGHDELEQYLFDLSHERETGQWRCAADRMRRGNRPWTFFKRF